MFDISEKQTEGPYSLVTIPSPDTISFTRLTLRLSVDMVSSAEIRIPLGFFEHAN